MLLVIKWLEFFTLASSFIMEGVIMSKGTQAILKPVLKPVLKHVSKPGRNALGIALTVWILTAQTLYLFFAVVWSFSETLPIQIGGVGLLVMTGLGLLLQGMGIKRGPLYAEIDSFFSLVALVIILLCRLQGL